MIIEPHIACAIRNSTEDKASPLIDPNVERLLRDYAQFKVYENLVRQYREEPGNKK